jgi:uncharacterized protein
MNLALLLAAVLGLLLGPALLFLKIDVSRKDGFLDGFTLVAVGGIAALHLIPEAILHGGWVALLFVSLGLLFPLVVNRSADRAGGRIEAFILLLGLLPHAFLESAALAAAPSDHLLGLGSAVAAHRLPVGLILFSMVQCHFGSLRGWAALLLLVGATLAGYWAGGPAVEALSGPSAVWLEALVGGSLLHVAFSHEVHTGEDGHEHAHDHDHSLDATAAGLKRERKQQAFGAILGATLLSFALGFGSGDAHGHGADIPFTDALVTLALKCAPALLAAYLISGLAGLLVKPRGEASLQGGSSLSQAIRGLFFGLASPITPNTALQTFSHLVRRGVPVAAGLGFLLAVPELGLDLILLSIPLFGAEFTLRRVAAALCIAVVAATVAGFLARGSEAQLGQKDSVELEVPFGHRAPSGLEFGPSALFDHSLPWVAAGLCIAAWSEPLLGHSLFQNVPVYLQIPVLALFGLPLYSCAAGALPLAAIAVHKGLSVGAVASFLLTSAMFSTKKFRAVYHWFGSRSAYACLLILLLGAAAGGLLCNNLAVETLQELDSHIHHGEQIWIQWGCLAGLAGLFLSSLFRQGPRGMLSQLTRPIRNADG